MSRRPYPYVDNWDLVILIAQVAWVVYAIILTVLLIRSMKRRHITFLQVIVDSGVVLFTIVAATALVLRTATLIKTLERIKSSSRY